MTTLTKKSVSVSKKVNQTLVDSLIREYKQTRWVPNSDRISKPDSLSAWYSIEDMENFLAEAKAHGGDGIKFYYAAYPEDFSAQPEYAGRQTLVTVATKSKITASGESANKDIYAIKNGKSEILSGLLPITCPPKCFSNPEGGMGDLGITIVDRGDAGLEIV